MRHHQGHRRKDSELPCAIPEQVQGDWCPREGHGKGLLGRGAGEGMLTKSQLMGSQSGSSLYTNLIEDARKECVWQSTTLIGGEAVWSKNLEQGDGLLASALRSGYFPHVRGPSSILKAQHSVCPAGLCVGFFLDAWEPVNLEDSHQAGENSRSLV